MMADDDENVNYLDERTMIMTGPRWNDNYPLLEIKHNNPPVFEIMLNFSAKLRQLLRAELDPVEEGGHHRH